jgi:multiple sugar transport system substrate-binding protein
VFDFQNRGRWLAAGVAVAAALSMTGACGDDDTGSDRSTGQTLTMWTRAATKVQTERFIEAYNKLGRNTVELRVIPNDNYLQQIATAAGGGGLPDILGADVVYAPNFISKGFFQEVTSRVKELSFASALAPAHVDVATASDKIYAVPHTIDLSVLFYNKVLYQRAGLDPEKPPATLAELAQHAKAIQALGGGVSGSYFEGQCPGCILFTLWPSVWADGGEVLSADGRSSNLDGQPMADVFAVWRQMHADGVIPEGAKAENGSTWITVWQTGKIGVSPMPSTFLSQFKEGPDLQIGVAGIPGVKGSTSTFVGGDVVGVSASSKKPAAAWDFLSWTLSDEAQRSVLGGNSDVMVRTDLTGAPEVAGNARLKAFIEIMAKGRTPKAINFGSTFNDPQGPWLTMMRDAIYGGDMRSALSKNDPLLDKSLAGS